MTSKQMINAFLSKAKTLVEQKRFIYYPRRKTIQTLMSLGLTISDLKDCICSLNDCNYYAGPKINYDGGGDIWEFKKYLFKKRIYIKLSIENDDEELLVCLSFHEDEPRS